MNSRVAAAVCLGGLILSSFGLDVNSRASAEPSKKAPDKDKDKKDKPDFPPFEKVIEGLKKVAATADGAAPLMDLYKDEDSGRLIAVLPAKYKSDMYMIASTISGGDPQSGVMGPTHFIKWRQIDKQIALIEPSLSIRTEGDSQAKASTDHLYSGRVLATLPILGMSPDKRPVVNIGALGTTQASDIFPPGAFVAYGASAGKLNPKLASLTKAKVFPQNVIFEYELPRVDGTLIRVTHAISNLEGTPGFKPRKADARVGYFYDYHRDFARTVRDEITSRYISRWCVEKADPALAISPPKRPIVWYVEHTTPIRFRRYVRDGILMWNDAFREIGIDNALEVYQQDAASGAHMEKDPEDVRYNFFRWNTSDQGYAIGPSRSNPLTGEILDADVVWHQGLIRSIRGQLESVSDDFVMESFGAETLAWLDTHPNWDPRIRLASPARQAELLRQRETSSQSAKGPATTSLNRCAMDDMKNRACHMGNSLSLELGLAEAAMLAGMLDGGPDDLLDGLPEKYIGGMIRYIAAHEVGHCLGLQHNMAASSWKSLEEINAPGFTGPVTASVMDYCAPNVHNEIGEVQGPYVTESLGKYDTWAIAYGYGPEEKLKDVLARVNEPGHLFVSQFAITFGGDPRNNTWDMGADSLEFAQERFGIVGKLMSTLLDKQVKEGESWKIARRRLATLNGVRVSAIRLASVWIGGSFINNNYKGDPNGRPPNEDVPGADQRKALNLIIANAFEDAAYGITPKILRHLAREYWPDPEEFPGFTRESSFPVHDAIGGVQAFALTMIMNPTKLRRIYDNELRACDSDDVLTLSEVMSSLTGAIYRECLESSRGDYSARSPMISGFRRNLQQEYVRRLTDLALLRTAGSASLRTVGTLAAHELRRIDKAVDKALSLDSDAYTQAHLKDIQTRIAKAREATYVIPQ